MNPKIETHIVQNKKIARVHSDDKIIKTVEEGSELLANLYYQEYEHIILERKHFSDVFFDLSNGYLGELLQKFSNFRTGITIVGDFKEHKSKSLHQFIEESKRNNKVGFADSISDALSSLKKY